MSKMQVITIKPSFGTFKYAVVENPDGTCIVGKLTEEYDSKKELIDTLEEGFGVHVIENTVVNWLKFAIFLIESNLAEYKRKEVHIYDEDTPDEIRQKDMTFGKIVGCEESLRILKSVSREECNESDMLSDSIKVEICKEYKSFEQLVSALDSCWDLYDTGNCDEKTQKNYEELAKMQVLEVYGWWRKAQGDVDFVDYPFRKKEMNT